MKLMLERDSSSGNKRGWEGGKNNGTWKGKSMNSFEEKTPVEIIEEKMQRLRTSWMDTRLRDPASRRKRMGGWEKQGQLRMGKQRRLGKH